MGLAEKKLLAKLIFFALGNSLFRGKELAMHVQSSTNCGLSYLLPTKNIYHFMDTQF